MTIIAFDSDSPFKGILAHLSESDPPAFEVSSSSASNPEIVASQTNFADYWESNPRKPQPYIQFDFQSNRVSISAYSLQVIDNDDDLKPHTWLVAVSNDEDEWTVIDEQEQNWELRGRAKVVSIGVETQTEETFRYVKIVMAEPNFFGEWQFILARVEFFGKIVSE
jgi:hypothetical protein